MQLNDEQLDGSVEARQGDVGDTQSAGKTSVASSASALPAATRARLFELVLILKQIHNRLAAEDRYKRTHDCRAATTNEKETTTS
jgi:hypothetical protein